MPDINVRGRYRAFTYDGITPLDFTTYANSLCVVRRPNEISFVTLRQYIPSISIPFTTFEPGSAYVVVSRDSDANFTMGPYTRVNRLPSSLNVKSPQYYFGLDKNSITIPLSVYALSVNNPLSSVTGITFVNGAGVSQSTVTVDQIRNGFQTSFTHFMPNSGYQLRNRTPYTFFAPLQSEMGDAFAFGNNEGGEYGMGYRYSQTRAFYDINGIPFVLSADQTFGIWDKMVFNSDSQQVTWNGQTFLASSLAALSACGTSKALFVLGSNLYGQLGADPTSPVSVITRQYYPTWTRVAGQWKDIDMGARHMIAINSSGHLYVCGNNAKGQLGFGPSITTINTLSLLDSTRNYAQVAAGYDSTHVRTADGQVYSCGDNTNGIIGINTGVTPIYALTREATNSTWSSIKTVKSNAGATASSTLVAFKNNTLYGCGRQSNYGGYNLQSNSYILTREVLNLSDITDFYTTGLGTFIKRQGQNYLFAAGSSGGTTDQYGNHMATLSAGGTQVFLPYFTKTTIPSSMINIMHNYTNTTTDPGVPNNFGHNYNLAYIGSDSYLYTKGSMGNVFAQKPFKAFDAFSSNAAGNRCPVFLLSAMNLRPSPTPTNTPAPTRTPTPTPAPAGQWVFVPNANAAGANTNVIYFSNDAITWTPRTISITDKLQSFAYDATNNRMIVQSYTQSSISTNGGAAWSNGGSLIGTNINRDMIYGNGVYAGVGGNSSVGPVGFRSTNNGASWAATTLPFPGSTSRQWNSITFGQGKFVSVSAGRAAGRTNVGAYSTDGINWTAATMPFFEWYIKTHYANNRFIATSYTVNPGGNGISYSSDGINWAASTRPSTTVFALPRGIAFNSANTRWIVTDSAMKAVYSDDNGATFNLIPGGTITNLFTASTDSITSGQGKFVIMTASNTAGYTATNQILISQNGLSWTYYPANFRTEPGKLYFLNN